MRILVKIDHMESGGAARVTSVLCNGLARRGHEVMLAYNHQRPTHYPLDERIQGIDNFAPRHGKSHWAGVMLMLRRVRRYRQIIRERQPDIIIGVEPEPYLYARWASIGSGIPVVAVDHTSYRRKQHWFTHWIRWRAYRWADKVSILSHVDEAILGKRLPNKTVIHNPIPFPVMETDSPREKMILCVGRMDVWDVKGFDRMVDIWGKLAASHPEWQLVFAGGGNDEAFRFLRQKAQEQGVEKQIQFSGVVTDMPSLYRRAAIFALPSRIEGFPMSLLEAASQGCACISFSIGGVAEEIYTNGQSGFIIEDDDEAAFADQLDTLIQQESTRERFSHAIREEMKRFSEEQFINTWEQLCRQLCKTNQ